MASSRVVLSPLGWSALAGGLGALLIGLLTLNLLLLVVPLAVLALTTAELLAFDRATRDFGPSWFRWRRFENSSQIRIDGVGSMALDLERVGPGSVYVEVFDPQPGAFEVVLGSPRLLTWWSGATPVRLAYVYRPRQRGRFRVGPTIVVAHDPLGFAWRRSGLEKVYVREHEEETHPEILLLLDTGWAMRLGVPGAESLEQAVESGTIIAGQALQRLDRVALLTYADRLVEFRPPQRGPPGAELLTQAFDRVTMAPARFDHLGALAAAREHLSAPTVIILLSTLQTVGGSVQGAVAELRTRGHRLIAFCPEVATLFPPAADTLSKRTMECAR